MATLQRQLTCDLELLRSQLHEDDMDPPCVDEVAKTLVQEVLGSAIADITGVTPAPPSRKPPPALPPSLQPYELHSEPADQPVPPQPPVPSDPPPAPRRPRPKAPKGKKRPSPALAAPQTHEPLSDRSALSQQTAQTTTSSRHTNQTAASSSTRQTTARSSASRVSSKAGRRQRVVSSEERLQSKYHELEQLLRRDFAAETARVCAESLREARQILHCTTAATRMVCGVVTDTQHSTWSPSASYPPPGPPPPPPPADRPPLPTLRFSPCDEEPSDEEAEAPRLSHRSMGHSSRSEVEPKRPKQRKQRRKEEAVDHSAHPQSVPPPEQTLVGYGVDIPKNGRPHTDHQLGNTDNDFIRRWLKLKNRQTRREKRMKRDEERLKREIDEELQKVDDKRREESVDAYVSWKKRKERQIRAEKRQQSSERRPLSPRTDAEGRVQIEGEDDDDEEEEEEKKERRGPRPVHNYVFPRPISPSHAPTSPTRPPKPTRMRIRGETLSATQRPSRPEPSPVRLSYDDWLKRKRSESAKRRKAEAEKRHQAAEAAVDAEMERIVPEMARQRLHESRESKRRVNSGLKAKPKVQRKPAENGERKENGPPGSQAFEWRTERPLHRPQSAKATLAPRSAAHQPRGRRPEPYGTEHPGTDVPTGTVLEEIVAAADEEAEENGRPVVPRLDLRGAFLTQGEE